MFSLIISPWVMGRTGGWWQTGTNEKIKKGKDDFFLNPVNFSNSVIFPGATVLPTGTHASLSC